MAKVQIGFDIGDGTLKIVQRDGNGIRRVVAEPLPDHLVQGGRILSFDAMADFIKATAHKNRLPSRDCAVVLPSGQAFLRRISLPAMTEEQLQVNLPYEFRDYLTQDKSQYFYDYAVNNLRRDEAGKAVELDLTCAAVQKSVVAEYREMFRRAGFKLRIAAPAECAYANLIRAFRAREGSAAPAELCILDLGHSATRIYIFNEDCFEATRVIEIGSSTVDQAIAEAMGVDIHVARTYKESNHDHAQGEDAAKSVYTGIAVEIMKAINFYGFNNRNSELQHAYYCGGGAQVPLLMEAVGNTVSLTLHHIRELLPSLSEQAEETGIFSPAAAGITMQ